MGGGGDVGADKDDGAKGDAQHVARPVIVEATHVLLDVADAVEGEDADQGQQQERDRALDDAAIVLSLLGAHLGQGVENGFHFVLRSSQIQPSYCRGARRRTIWLLCLSTSR